MKMHLELFFYAFFCFYASQSTAFPIKELNQNILSLKSHSPVSTDLTRLARQNRRNYFSYTLNSQANDYVTVNAIAKHNVTGLHRELQRIGLKNSTIAGRIISGLIPIASLNLAASIENLHMLSADYFRTHNTVITQGKAAMRVDQIPSDLGLSGKGIKVGVISDSYNCFAKSDDSEEVNRSADIDIASGELPEKVAVLEEANICMGKSDEGRALMQIIYDIAPDAELFFFSGANGMSNTINGLNKFYKEKVRIIVDDTASSLESFFQDGPLNQLIDQLSENGIVYITSAGNSARNGYQAPFRETYNPHLNIHAHDFDPSENIDVFQAFTLKPGSSITLELQWADPAYSVSGLPGAATDLDLFIVNEAGTDVLSSATEKNTGRDPSEVVQFFNPEHSEHENFNILITKSSGPAPTLMKYIVNGRFNGEILEHVGNDGTITGRSNAISSLTVGAASYDQTPAFGATSPVLQFFSSAGGDTAILFDSEGIRLAKPTYRQKPEFVAPDNSNTTFFQFNKPNADYDNDSLPNFIGTSAAAPHAAGLVALLLQLNPDLQPSDVKSILQETALDIHKVNTEDGETYNNIQDGEGRDDYSGYGFIDAVSAVELAKNFQASRATREGIDTKIKPEAMPSGAGASDATLVIILLINFLSKTLINIKIRKA